MFVVATQDSFLKYEREVQMDQFPTVFGLPKSVAVYGVLILVGLVGAVGDAAVNQWAQSHKVGWWLVSCLIWIGAATLFGIVLRWGYFSFGISVVLALLVHAAMVLLLDRMYYGVRLASIQWAGILCAVVAFCLLEIGRQASAPSSEAREPPSTSEGLRE